MIKKEYQKKYAEVKKRMHTSGAAYGSQEYRALKDLMNYYYKKGFC